MKMGFNLTLEMQQKLVMTPELKMALKILQLPTMELEELIEYELQSNPVLEMIEEQDFEKKEVKSDVEKKQEETNKDNGIDWKEYLQYQGKSYNTEHSNPDEDEEYPFENIGSTSITLRDHLLSQLQMIKISGKEKMVTEYIIEEIDENGYFTSDIEGIAKKFKMEFSEVEELLHLVQGFDPCGVGARNLRECLLIQLNEWYADNEKAKIIVSDYLEDVACNRLGLIAKQLKISVEETQSITDLIKTLVPKPGRGFDGNNTTKYITPDAFIEKVNDEYIIIINDFYSSRLMISNYYKSILNNGLKDDVAVKYINDRLSAASWLIRSIEHRKDTIYRIIEEIIIYQRDFFDHGVNYLKTLTLKKIADKVEVHESTVSRAINGKYVQTPNGVYELKYFFKSGVDSDAGDGVSSESIKQVIKNIIASENPQKPYSDQEIVDMISEGEHMQISRRTVTKYRDSLGILSSSKRKRY